MPLPRSRKRLPGCVPLGMVSVSSPFSVRYLDLPAEHQRGIGHRQVAPQVVILAVKEFVVRNADHDEQVARRAAARAVLALSVQAELLPGGDARRHLEGQFPLLLDASPSLGRSGTDP